MNSSNSSSSWGYPDNEILYYYKQAEGIRGNDKNEKLVDLQNSTSPWLTQHPQHEMVSDNGPHTREVIWVGDDNDWYNGSIAFIWSLHAAINTSAHPMTSLARGPTLHDTSGSTTTYVLPLHLIGIKTCPQYNKL